MLKSFICTVIIGIGMLFHPFHVSVCDIEHNAESNSLEISQRIFVDDLEIGLKKFHKLEYLDALAPKDPARLDSLLALYLNAKLSIEIDGKKIEIKYLGSEIEGDARWCYLEAANIKSVPAATLKNTVLVQSFDDQENIVHFKANDKLKSYRLNKDEAQTTFTWWNEIDPIILNLSAH